MNCDGPCKMADLSMIMLNALKMESSDLLEQMQCSAFLPMSSVIVTSGNNKDGHSFTPIIIAQFHDAAVSLRQQIHC